MLEIKEMQNCYGIKKLEMGSNTEFKRINLIFAPNGTFKTSFFNTLKDYSSDSLSNVMDRLTKEVGEVDIDLGGVPLKKEEIILFDKEIVAEIDKMKSLKLIANKKAMHDYNTLQNFLSDLQDITQEDSSKNKYEYLTNLLEVSNSENFLTFEKDFSKYLNEYKLDKLKYSDFTKSQLLDDEVQSDIRTVIQIEKKSLELIKSNLGIKDVDKSIEFVKKLYDAGHKIQLKANEDKYLLIDTFEKFKELFDFEKNLLQEEVKKNSEEFKRIIKVLDNNQANRKIKTSITNNIENLQFFNTQEEYIKIYYNLKKMRNYKLSEIHLAYQNLRTYSQLVRPDKLKETVSQFNKRFYDHLQIQIEDEEHVDLGLNLQKVIVNFYNQKVSGEDISQIASTGEKNALAMFLLMHSVMSNNNEKKLLIIDDELEVFDYAFKHSFIEYLNDMCDEESLRVIILTHNYDFIRSFSTRINIDRRKKADELALMVAYKNDDQVVEISKVKKFNNLNLNTMYKKINENNIFSYIVTKRNIEEIEGNNDNFNYLTSLLHFKDDTQNITIDDLRDFIKVNSQNAKEDFKAENHGKKYIEFLYERADKICVDCKASSNLFLDEKIALAIACRLKFESKFIGGKSYSTNQTRGIYNDLSDDNKTLYNDINIIVPDFIHLNAFSYEPLMDIKIDRLIRFYELFNK